MVGHSASQRTAPSRQIVLHHRDAHLKTVLPTLVTWQWNHGSWSQASPGSSNTSTSVSFKENAGGASPCIWAYLRLTCLSALRSTATLCLYVVLHICICVYSSTVAQ